MARRFEIEIEFGYSGDLADAVRALNAAGLTRATRVDSYSAFSPTDWVIKRDGSVGRGGEMVSPPLDIDDPAQREQVTRAIMALRSIGATTYEAAGIHVHIDGANMTGEELAAVARLFVKFEDCIYRVASSGWDAMRVGASNFCKPMSQARAQAIAKAKTPEQVAQAYYGAASTQDAMYRGQSHGDHSRYCGLNLHSWFYRRTIEFRVFNSSLNPERVQGYIGMCMAMVQDARNGFRRSINKRYALGGMEAGTTNADNARHRFLQVLRYDGKMALEDMERLTKIWKDSKPQSARLVSFAY